MVFVGLSDGPGDAKLELLEASVTADHQGRAGGIGDTAVLEVAADGFENVFKDLEQSNIILVHLRIS